jgi:capsular polysaccharide biosynthesis protein
MPNGLHENLVEALRRVNIHDHPVIYLDSGIAYHVDRLVVPSALSRVIDRYKGHPVFDTDIVLSQKWISRVADLLKNNAQPGQKPWRKLYLTRKAGLRSLGNREEIELLVSEHGFEIVDLVGMSLEAQIELFSQASLIVAPTGAALTNMLFCPPGTKVIIFMSNHEVMNYYFWSNLGTIVNLDITTIVGERLFNLTNYWSVHDDYSINPNTLLEEITKYEHD